MPRIDPLESAAYAAAYGGVASARRMAKIRAARRGVAWITPLFSLRDYYEVGIAAEVRRAIRHRVAT